MEDRSKYTKSSLRDDSGLIDRNGSGNPSRPSANAGPSARGAAAGAAASQGLTGILKS